MTSKSLAGASYVAAWPREELPGDRYANGAMRVHKIRIAVPEHCMHAETICLSCAGDWAQDWDLLWKRTSGGRRLASSLNLTLNA